jgi:hypothetical protein
MLRHDALKVHFTGTLIQPSAVSRRMIDVQDIGGAGRQNPFQLGLSAQQGHLPQVDTVEPQEIKCKVPDVVSPTPHHGGKDGSSVFIGYDQLSVQYVCAFTS